MIELWDQPQTERAAIVRRLRMAVFHFQEAMRCAEIALGMAGSRLGRDGKAVERVAASLSLLAGELSGEAEDD